MRNPLGEQICTTLLKLQGYFTDKIEFADYKGTQQVHIHIRSLNEPICPVCGSIAPVKDIRIRHIKHASILFRPVILVLYLRRTNCPDCGVRTELQTISDGIKRHSKELEKMILLFSHKLDNSSIAKLLGFSASSVYRIDKSGLQLLEQQLVRNVPKTAHISIDELAHKKRHHYTTVLTNQEDAKVIDLSWGKSKLSALNLFKTWDDKLNWLETISMDFSQSYISAATEHFAEHYIVFDRFHFSRIVNRHLEQIRRDIQKDLPEELRKKIKKQSRWLILRRKKNLTDKHINHIEQLKLDNEPLYEAYLLKEDLLSLFDDSISVDEAETRLIDWCLAAESTNYEPFRRLAKQIRNRLKLLLNWFKHRISNAKAEAVNNLIKALLRRAFGYKDYQYFRLKVLQKCGYLMYAFHSI